MLIEPMYYAVFFDVDLPQTVQYALNKRMDQKQYNNLTDGIEGKNLELQTINGKVSLYRLISTKTFLITNTVDNCYYVICEVKKT